mmetsp:Transcript_13116/g.27914  ORF Transcript_13116/g.27914 Transcript_13116/m.27914 type:complete len:98 (+) Transcript_13116:679-972(+)
MGELLLPPDLNAAGTSRARLMKPSEPFMRVLAMLLSPMEVSWVKQGKGQERLYVNLLYVLCDEAGGLHLPRTTVAGNWLCLRRKCPTSVDKCSPMRS